MMKLLHTLFILLGPLASFACSCAGAKLTPAGLKSQTYVALVKIKEQLPFDEAKYRNRDQHKDIHYEVLIDEIVLIKGTSQQKISVSGAPPQSKTIRTSCDIDVSPGQEWIIIENANLSGSVGIGMCGYSMRYRDKDGFRDWQYGTATKWLKFVNETLPNPQLAGILNLEQPVLYYPNGQIERTTSYRNHKKNGTALFYYPDGTIYGRAEYKQDSLNGPRIWYDRRGQIQSKATYRMGIPIDTMIFYMYPNAPMYVSIRSKRGVIQKFQEYQGDMTTRTSSYLYAKTLHRNGEQTSKTYYRQDGTIRSVSKFHPRGTTDLKYDEKGVLIETREFDKRGKRY